MFARLRVPALILASLLTALLCVELGLRMLGIPSIPPGGYHLRSWALRDSELGWRIAPGSWELGCNDHVATFDGTGARATEPPGSAPSPDDRPVILLVGGSYALGYGVDDQHSLAWVAQSLLPGARVVNMAVPGYGTYQSLLMVRRYLREHRALPPTMAVYGYCDHHTMRNVADRQWLLSLKSYSAGQIIHPHLAQDESGTWTEQPPSELPPFPLARFSRTMLLLQNVAHTRQFEETTGMTRLAATEAALEMLVRECEDSGVRLLVANIFRHGNFYSNRIERLCRRADAGYAVFPETVSWASPDWFLAADDGTPCGHPNERYNEAVGTWLAGEIKTRLTRIH